MNNVILTVVLVFSCTTFIFAQENNALNKVPTPHFHRHHLALFNGATSNFSHETASYTIGIDYEYRISQLFGIGVLAEYIAAPDEFLVGAIVFVHPFKGTKFLVAPLAVFAEKHTFEGHEDKHETNFGIRIGAGYDFHIGRFSIGPAINFDFGETEALNYGLSVGFGF